MSEYLIEARNLCKYFPVDRKRQLKPNETPKSLHSCSSSVRMTSTSSLSRRLKRIVR